MDYYYIIINGYLIGPYFYGGHVTQHTYLQLLREELPLFLENVDLHTRTECGYKNMVPELSEIFLMKDLTIDGLVEEVP